MQIINYCTLVTLLLTCVYPLATNIVPNSIGTSGLKDGIKAGLDTLTNNPILGNLAQNGKQFSGVTYSPYTTGACKSANQVASELAKVAKLTSNVRLYGCDCQQLENVLQAIASQNLNMNVVAGTWTRNGQGQVQQEVDHIIQLLKSNPKYKSILSGVTVGNEEMFNGSNPSKVIQDINFVRDSFKKAGLNLQVSTVEVGSKWTPELAQASDVLYANIYSFFNPQQLSNMDEAAQSVLTQYQDLNKRLDCKSLGKQLILGETGWPAAGTSNSPNTALATPDNQAKFLNSLACKAKSNNLQYFVLEPFDAPWKKGPTIEQNFGFLNQDGSFKASSNLYNKC